MKKEDYEKKRMKNESYEKRRLGKKKTMKKP